MIFSVFKYELQEWLFVCLCAVVVVLFFKKKKDKDFYCFWLCDLHPTKVRKSVRNRRKNWRITEDIVDMFALFNVFQPDVLNPFVLICECLLHQYVFFHKVFIFIRGNVRCWQRSLTTWETSASREGKRVNNVDYEQCLFFLGPSSKTPETRKWPRVSFLTSRSFAAQRSHARALPLLNLKKKSL